MNDDTDDAATASVARRWHLIGFALLTLIGIYGVLQSLRLGVWRQHSPGEGLFPLLTSSAMTGFGAFCLAAAWLRRDNRAADAAAARASLRNIAIYVGGLVFYAATLDALGFLLATVIAVVFILRVAEHYSWAATLALAIGTAAFCQVLFVVWLGAILPTGDVWDNLLYRP